MAKPKTTSRTPSQSGQKTLYAWAKSAYFKGSLLDHTWVTTERKPYNSIEQLSQDGEYLWYCWGGFHKTGNETKSIGAQPGDLTFANCIAQANVECNNSIKARGTIFQYGIDGVCHQLANQVLFSTGTEAPPLTVSKARSYIHSVFIYGEYGLNSDAWQSKNISCTPGRGQSSSDGNSTMTDGPDEFEKRARDVLGPADPKLLSALLRLRSEAQTVRLTLTNDPELLNEQNQLYFEKAAELLGPELFKKIFNLPSDQKVILIDSNIFNAAKAAALPKPRASKPITTEQLVGALADQHELTKRASRDLFDNLIAMITHHLKKGERVKIAGLGILQVRKRAARIGRNPKTGEILKVKAGKNVKFRAEKKLRDSIDGHSRYKSR